MTATSKLRVAVLYGGRSAEHDVSVLSAANVLRALDPARFEAVPVFVTREGRWLLAIISDGRLTRQPERDVEICLLPGGGGRLLAVPADGVPHELPAIDILFPVLHGLHGEDGAVQGAAEVARVPLAGCGILGSAAALDKEMTKRLLRAADLPAARAMTILPGEEPAFGAVERELGLPVFVKPARQGSSVGVSKVASAADYAAALATGFQHDGKLLVEEFIGGREIEFAVLEGVDGTLFVSCAGEIAAAERHGFYSYDAKYVDEAGARLSIPADIPSAVEARMRDAARAAFQALGCDGMARVDFFLLPDMRFVINELNTIPGFTDISMYSKVMAASGVAYATVLDRLIEHGLARARRTAIGSSQPH